MESQVQEELMVCKGKGKGKRTKRQRLPSPLRLAMPMPSSASSSAGRITSADNSSTSDSTQEEEDMANCLILLAQGSHAPKLATSSSEETVNVVQPQNGYVYQCKTCNRCFPSFQALGGHRASHKKPKPEEKLQAVTFLIKHEDHDRLYDNSTTTSTDLSLQLSSRALYKTSIANNNKAKVHDCSICGAEFSSGQALGGHMRRHRTFANMPATATASSSEAKKPRNVLKLDLNLPAPEDDLHGESKFPFQSKEKVLVFSASSLVDCHY